LVQKRRYVYNKLFAIFLLWHKSHLQFFLLILRSIYDLNQIQLSKFNKCVSHISIKEVAYNMRLFKRKEKEKDSNNNTSTLIKCKHCDMEFEDKERLKIHDKKAHSGKGERKKMKK
jgi:uncharacterized C2H2 Zn-finger protein